ncbi:MAG: DUF308 domain-containing protein [Anaerolineales bacterium]|nr:DUF308 domain-containing protein [Anaerolineales bacterium]
MIESPSHLQEYPWWRLLVQGLLSLGAGILLMFRPSFSLDVAILVLGIYWLVLGITSWFTLLSGRTHGRRLWYVLRGTLELFAGLVALGFTQLATFGGANVVNTVIGVAGLVIGIISLLQAFQGGGWPSGLLGILSIGFAVFVFATRLFNIFDVTWLAGLIAVLAGLASIIAAFSVRASGKSEHNPALGIWRMVAMLVLLPLALVAIFVAWVSHVRWRGFRLHEWGVTYLCRLILRLLGVGISCAQPQKITGMQGILFVNHLTFIDIPVLAGLAPMRFLSTAEVYQVPVVGWVAKQIDTVFVNRRKREARQASRSAIAESLERSLTPPFVIFLKVALAHQQVCGPFITAHLRWRQRTNSPIFPLALPMTAPTFCGGRAWRKKALSKWPGAS